MKRAVLDVGTVLSTNSGHRYVVISNEDVMSMNKGVHALTSQQEWIDFQLAVATEACRNIEAVTR